MAPEPRPLRQVRLGRFNVDSIEPGAPRPVRRKLVHAHSFCDKGTLSTNQEVYQLKVCTAGICRDGTLYTCIPKGPLWIKRSVFTCCQAGYEPKHNAWGPLKTMASFRAVSLPPLGGNAFWSERVRSEWELSQMRPEGLPPMESPQGGGVPIPSDDDLDEPQPVQGAGEEALRGRAVGARLERRHRSRSAVPVGNGRQWMEEQHRKRMSETDRGSEDFRTPPSGMTASELRGKV